MASTHMGSIIWGAQRYIPHVEEDFGAGGGDVANTSNVSIQPPPFVGSEEDSLLVAVDSEEEDMYPFDTETFVDRIVEDEPPPLFTYERARGDWIWEAPVAAGTPRGKVEIDNKHAREQSVAGKPYDQPIFFWPEPGQVCEGEALVVRNDSPGWISSPEVARGVNSGPVKAPRLESNHRGGSRGCYGGDMAEFEPVAMDNIPVLVDLLPLDYQMSWVPAQSGCDDFSVTSSVPITYANGSENDLEPMTGAIFARATPSSITAPADPSAARTPLIGAAAEDYDDDNHAFLRKQEVTRYVGPGYLVRPGKSGLVTPEQRASLVDWLSKVHAAAPAASGNATPLSVEALALAVNILDRFLSTSEGGKVVLSGWGEVKIASVACLGLASKYEDTQPPTLLGLAVVMTSANELEHGLRGDNLIGQGGGDDNVLAMRKEIVAMEQRVSSALGYRLTVPTVISFLGVFIYRACLLGYLPEGQAKDVVRKEAERILLRVLRESCSLSHLPSALAAAALYWASCITPGIVAPSSFTFFPVTGYQLDSLYCCLRDVEVVRIASGAGGMGWGDE